MLRPIGPESSSVYWRRRAALLVVLTLLVYILFRSFFGGSGKAAESKKQSSSRPSVTATTTPGSGPTPTLPVTTPTQPVGGPTGGPTDGGTGGGGGTTGGTGTGTGTGGGGGTTGTSGSGVVVPGYCLDSNVRVAVKPDNRRYKLTTKPNFIITAMNVGDGACKFDLGTKNWSLTVMTGVQRVWNSDDCPSPQVSKVVTLQYLEPVTTTLTWDWVRSKTGCPSSQPTALPGTYTAQVTFTGGVTSPKAVFVLEA